MKKTREFKSIAVALCCALTAAVTTATISQPITASASWHWDFWNDYEDDCTVVYTSVNSFGAYKVVVMSSDCHKIWTNDDANVPYWYSTSKLRTMIGEDPELTGWKIVDVRTDLLNDTNYFKRFSC